MAEVYIKYRFSEFIFLKLEYTFFLRSSHNSKLKTELVANVGVRKCSLQNKIINPRKFQC